MLLKLNCQYYSQISFKKDIEFSFKAKSADKLSAKLRELIIVCGKNLYYAQKL